MRSKTFHQSFMLAVSLPVGNTTSDRGQMTKDKVNNGHIHLG